MCKILISIKPEYTNKIISGEKTFEFRRRIPNREVSSLVIYATYPVGKVVGEVKVNGILEDTPTKIWNSTKENAGISRKKYFEYFTDSPLAYAYKLGDIIKFKKPRDLSYYDIDKAPQSFIYLD